MDKTLICHICGNETEFTCDRCDEPVCEDCCTPMTYHNQIDYPLCITCNQGREAAISQYYREQEKEKELLQAKKDARNKKRRENYWKPENVEKRKAVKESKKREQAEIARKQLAETMKLIRSFLD